MIIEHLTNLWIVGAEIGFLIAAFASITKKGYAKILEIGRIVVFLMALLWPIMLIVVFVGEVNNDRKK